MDGLCVCVEIRGYWLLDNISNSSLLVVGAASAISQAPFISFSSARGHRRAMRMESNNSRGASAGTATKSLMVREKGSVIKCLVCITDALFRC